MMWFKSTDQKVLALRSQLSKARKIIEILEAERDALAEVLARDRMRVAAETAIHARAKAEAEGQTDVSNQNSSVRFSA